MATRTRTSSDTKTVLEVAPVVHEGDAIVLPAGPPPMSLDRAIRDLQRRKEYDEEETAVTEVIDCHPLDGAHAMMECLIKRFGWAQAQKTPGFYGDDPPHMVSVEVGVGRTKNVGWGRFRLPNVDGWIQTGTEKKNGYQVFALKALVKRKDKTKINDLANDIRNYLKTGSIYRGKAIKVRFDTQESFWEGETRVATIRFMDIENAAPERLVFPIDVEEDIAGSVYTPIERSEDAAAALVPLKRGILFAGDPGTGKTELLKTIAKLCTDNDKTYIQCERADEFPEAIAFARQYEEPYGCGVGCEDIDRVMSGTRHGAEGSHLDVLLNTVDGIEAKNTKIMVFLTTNDVESINRTALRPGRLDHVIHVQRPDAEAVTRLLRLYGGEYLAPKEDLGPAGYILSGQNAAVVREVVERSKLWAIRREPVGLPNGLHITCEDLVRSAKSMQMQIELLNHEPAVAPSDLLVAVNTLGQWLVAGMDYLRAVHPNSDGSNPIAVTGESGEYRRLPSYPEGAFSTLRQATSHKEK